MYVLNKLDYIYNRYNRYYSFSQRSPFEVEIDSNDFIYKYGGNAKHKVFGDDQVIIIIIIIRTKME